jgi:hypothetical protein
MKDLQEVRSGDMDHNDMVQDRYRWQALADAVMNLWVPYNAGNFLTSSEIHKDSSPQSLSKSVMEVPN